MYVSSYAVCHLQVQGSPRRRVRPFYASASCASYISRRPLLTHGRHHRLNHWLTQAYGARPRLWSRWTRSPSRV